jgi:hypothetical protein
MGLGGKGKKGQAKHTNSNFHLVNFSISKDSGSFQGVSAINKSNYLISKFITGHHIYGQEGSYNGKMPLTLLLLPL